MNIVVLSGGSGNDALVKGLKSLGCFNHNIKVIVNAYDNGKSTGICRAVTDTLGVSDIRKNHSRMYEAKYGEKCNKNLLEFYNGRFDFEKGKEEEKVISYLQKWELNDCIPYAKAFFKEPKAHDFEYKSFSVSNIVYSQMYREIGYEKTNKFFCDKLGVDDFVILNSFDNIFIKAKTQSGFVIDDEGKTVFWNNPNDKIVKTIYEKGAFCENKLNPKAVEAVQNADLIIISTGTFWSSIQPTVEYLDFYKYINRSNAKKIWVMNNEEDGDAFGVSSLEFVSFMEQTGLDLGKFSILVNADACEKLRQTDKKHNFVIKKMGNINGKHDCKMYARAIMELYYGLEDKSKYDKIIFDFDDTIWARKCDEKILEVSKSNINIINSDLVGKAVIISGNSYESIKAKLSTMFGQNLEALNVELWADANSTLFQCGKVKDYVEEFIIDDASVLEIEELAKIYNLKLEKVGIKSFNFKIKPLSTLERQLLTELINAKHSNFRAKITGTTTVDIVSTKNNKEAIFRRCGFDKLRTLYIGDELKRGNDVEISKLCSKSIEVSGVMETNLILNLLRGE